MYKICGKNGRDGDETIQNKWHDKRLRNLRNYKRFFRFFFASFCFRQRKAFACFGFLSEGSLLICVLRCFFLSLSLFPSSSVFHFVPGRQFIYGFAFIKKIFIHVFLFIFLRAALNLFCVTGCLPVCLCMCVYLCVCGRCCIRVCAVPVVLLLFNIN